MLAARVLLVALAVVVPTCWSLQAENQVASLQSQSTCLQWASADAWCISAATNSCNSSCLNSTAEDLLAACLSSGTSGAQAIQVALASDAHSHTAYATVAAAVQGSLKDVTGIQLSISNKTHDSAQPTLHLLSWPAAASLLEVGLLEDLGLTSAEPAPYSSYLGSTVNATAAGPTAATWSIASDAGLGVQGDVLPLALAMATAPSSRQPSTQPISPAPGYLAAFPVQGPQLLALYYRADLLPGQGAPRTWADLVHLLAALNTTATSQSTGSQPGPGDLQKPAYPLCMASCNTLATGDGSVGTCQPGWCSAAHAGLAVLASLLQTHGWAGPPGTSLPAWGVAADVFRPGRVLGSAATSAALQLLESLAPYTHAPSLPAQPSKNSTVSNQQCSCDVVESFLAGSCWVALAGPDLFKVASRPGSPLAGRLGVWVLPGSTQVLSAQLNQLVNCTPDICPTAAAHQTSTPVVQLAPALIINTSPYVGPHGALLGLSPTPTRATHLVLRRLLRAGAHPAVALALALDNTTAQGPVRRSHLDPHLWTAAGYHPQDTAAFLAAYSASMTHPNAALGPPSDQVGQLVLRELGAAAAAVITGSTTAAAAAALLASRYPLHASPSPPSTPPSSSRPPAPLPYSPGTSPTSAPVRAGGLQPQYLAAILAPVLVAVVVALGLAVLLFVSKRAEQHLFRGEVMPPGAGPETTLLITDVQDSTTLWELLPEEVMDTACKLHDALLTRLLSKWRGYCSFTEGDSFVTAFHDPRSALNFALDAQAQLLTVPWPELVLQQPQCAPVYCQHTPERSPAKFVREADRIRIFHTPSTQLSQNQQQGAGARRSFSVGPTVLSSSGALSPLMMAQRRPSQMGRTSMDLALAPPQPWYEDGYTSESSTDQGEGPAGQDIMRAGAKVRGPAPAFSSRPREPTEARESSMLDMGVLWGEGGAGGSFAASASMMVRRAFHSITHLGNLKGEPGVPHPPSQHRYSIGSLGYVGASGTGPPTGLGPPQRSTTIMARFAFLRPSPLVPGGPSGATTFFAEEESSWDMRGPPPPPPARIAEARGSWSAGAVKRLPFLMRQQPSPGPDGPGTGGRVRHTADAAAVAPVAQQEAMHPSPLQAHVPAPQSRGAPQLTSPQQEDRAAGSAGEGGRPSTTPRPSDTAAVVVGLDTETLVVPTPSSPTPGTDAPIITGDIDALLQADAAGAGQQPAPAPALHSTSRWRGRTSAPLVLSGSLPSAREVGAAMDGAVEERPLPHSQSVPQDGNAEKNKGPTWTFAKAGVSDLGPADAAALVGGMAEGGTCGGGHNGSHLDGRGLGSLSPGTPAKAQEGAALPPVRTVSSDLVPDRPAAVHKQLSGMLPPAIGEGVAADGAHLSVWTTAAVVTSSQPPRFRPHMVAAVNTDPVSSRATDSLVTTSAAHAAAHSLANGKVTGGDSRSEGLTPWRSNAASALGGDELITAAIEAAAAAEQAKKQRDSIPTLATNGSAADAGAASGGQEGCSSQAPSPHNHTPTPSDCQLTLEVKTNPVFKASTNGLATEGSHEYTAQQLQGQSTPQLTLESGLEQEAAMMVPAQTEVSSLTMAPQAAAHLAPYENPLFVNTVHQAVVGTNGQNGEPGSSPLPPRAVAAQQAQGANHRHLPSHVINIPSTATSLHPEDDHPSSLTSQDSDTQHHGSRVIKGAPAAVQPPAPAPLTSQPAGLASRSQPVVRPEPGAAVLDSGGDSVGNSSSRYASEEEEDTHSTAAGAARHMHLAAPGRLARSVTDEEAHLSRAAAAHPAGPTGRHKKQLRWSQGAPTPPQQQQLPAVSRAPGYRRDSSTQVQLLQRVSETGNTVSASESGPSNRASLAGTGTAGEGAAGQPPSRGGPRGDPVAPLQPLSPTPGAEEGATASSSSPPRSGLLSKLGGAGASVLHAALLGVRGGIPRPSLDSVPESGTQTPAQGQAQGSPATTTSTGTEGTPGRRLPQRRASDIVGLAASQLMQHLGANTPAGKAATAAALSGSHSRATSTAARRASTGSGGILLAAPQGQQEATALLQRLQSLNKSAASRRAARPHERAQGSLWQTLTLKFVQVRTTQVSVAGVRLGLGAGEDQSLVVTSASPTHAAAAAGGTTGGSWALQRRGSSQPGADPSSPMSFDGACGDGPTSATRHLSLSGTAGQPQQGTLLWRGFRVRIGMHSGVASEAQITLTHKNAARRVYSGRALLLAKAVSDAMHGGLISLSATSRALLPRCVLTSLMPGGPRGGGHQGRYSPHRSLAWVSSLWVKDSSISSSGAGAAPGAGRVTGDGAGLDSSKCEAGIPALMWHCGQYCLTELDIPMDIHVACSEQLLGRWALLPALVRVTSARLSPSVFDAPVTPRVYCASIRVVGLSTLLAWDQQVARDALDVMDACLERSAATYSGYLSDTREVDSADVVAVFSSPNDAVGWVLTCRELLLHEDWPLQLLAHELGEEIMATVAISAAEPGSKHDNLSSAQSLAHTAQITAFSVPAASVHSYTNFKLQSSSQLLVDMPSAASQEAPGPLQHRASKALSHKGTHEAQAGEDTDHSRDHTGVGVTARRADSIASATTRSVRSMVTQRSRRSRLSIRTSATRTSHQSATSERTSLGSLASSRYAQYSQSLGRNLRAGLGPSHLGWGAGGGALEEPGAAGGGGAGVMPRRAASARPSHADLPAGVDPESVHPHLAAHVPSFHLSHPPDIDEDHVYDAAEGGLVLETLDMSEAGQARLQGPGFARSSLRPAAAAPPTLSAVMSVVTDGELQSAVNSNDHTPHAQHQHPPQQAGSLHSAGGSGSSGNLNHSAGRAARAREGRKSRLILGGVLSELAAAAARSFTTGKGSPAVSLAHRSESVASMALSGGGPRSPAACAHTHSAHAPGGLAGPRPRSRGHRHSAGPAVAGGQSGAARWPGEEEVAAGSRAPGSRGLPSRSSAGALMQPAGAGTAGRRMHHHSAQATGALFTPFASPSPLPLKSGPPSIIDQQRRSAGSGARALRLQGPSLLAALTSTAAAAGLLPPPAGESVPASSEGGPLSVARSSRGRSSRGRRPAAAGMLDIEEGGGGGGALFWRPATQEGEESDGERTRALPRVSTLTRRATHAGDGENGELRTSHQRVTSERGAGAAGVLSDEEEGGEGRDPRFTPEPRSKSVFVRRGHLPPDASGPSALSQLYEAALLGEDGEWDHMYAHASFRNAMRRAPAPSNKSKGPLAALARALILPTQSSGILVRQPRPRTVSFAGNDPDQHQPQDLPPSSSGKLGKLVRSVLGGAARRDGSTSQGASRRGSLDLPRGHGGPSQGKESHWGGGRLTTRTSGHSGPLSRAPEPPSPLLLRPRPTRTSAQAPDMALPCSPDGAPLIHVGLAPPGPHSSGLNGHPSDQQASESAMNMVEWQQTGRMAGSTTAPCAPPLYPGHECGSHDLEHTSGQGSTSSTGRHHHPEAAVHPQPEGTGSPPSPEHPSVLHSGLNATGTPQLSHISRPDTSPPPRPRVSFAGAMLLDKGAGQDDSSPPPRPRVSFAGAVLLEKGSGPESQDMPPPRQSASGAPPARSILHKKGGGGKPQRRLNKGVSFAAAHDRGDSSGASTAAGDTPEQAVRQQLAAVDDSEQEGGAPPAPSSATPFRAASLRRASFADVAPRLSSSGGGEAVGVTPGVRTRRRLSETGELMGGDDGEGVPAAGDMRTAMRGPALLMQSGLGGGGSASAVLPRRSSAGGLGPSRLGGGAAPSPPPPVWSALKGGEGGKRQERRTGGRRVTWSAAECASSSGAASSTATTSDEEQEEEEEAKQKQGCSQGSGGSQHSHSSSGETSPKQLAASLTSRRSRLSARHDTTAIITTTTNSGQASSRQPGYRQHGSRRPRKPLPKTSSVPEFANLLKQQAAQAAASMALAEGLKPLKTKPSTLKQSMSVGQPSLSGEVTQQPSSAVSAIGSPASARQSPDKLLLRQHGSPFARTSRGAVFDASTPTSLPPPPAGMRKGPQRHSTPAVIARGGTDPGIKERADARAGNMGHINQRASTGARLPGYPPPTEIVPASPAPSLGRGRNGPAGSTRGLAHLRSSGGQESGSLASPSAAPTSARSSMPPGASLASPGGAGGPGSGGRLLRAAGPWSRHEPPDRRNSSLSLVSRLSGKAGLNPHTGAKLMYRGLRIKGAVDYGSVTAAVSCISGRMMYEGKCVTRVAKLLSAALTGQVVCSQRISTILTCPDPDNGLSLAVTSGFKLTQVEAGTRGKRLYTLHVDEGGN